MNPVRAAVALGSNLGDRLSCLAEARDRLGRTAGVALLARSTIYRTEPVGGPAQGEFANAVDLFDVEPEPCEFLEALLAIERAMGRVRRERWGPRSIDLDLLFHGMSATESPGLALPHPELHKRSFVLAPLAEVAPDWSHPVLGLT
ncbi:MAG: 2-amino-4-hydroxy-6-hydroxymethyldihydropteridine diphosphokinase, partial [Planctomycetes bacterium]|nr:2-amino-4-hydroxy-6-hydroxymethyldihydropteridine diphosphokinase [Planctomycetota bacterium]